MGAGLSANQEVVTLAQYYGLPKDPASKGQPVRIRAVVLCYDAGWNQLYVHDGHETAYFNPQLFQTRPELGQVVEITGTTTVAQGAPALTNAQLTILGRGTLPAAKQLGLSQLASDFGQWVETGGRVRVVDTSWGRLALQLLDQGRDCLVYVMALPGTNDVNGFLDCRVRVRGINASQITNGQLDSAQLTVPGFSEVTVVERPAAIRPQPEVLSIGGLLNRELGAWTNSRVCINGLISSYEPAHTLVVSDPTGKIRAQVIQTTQAQPGTRVTVRGFLEITPKEAFLSNASFEVMPALAKEAVIRAARAQVPRPAENDRELTQISEILKLRREEAAQRWPVKLRGVMTFADPAWRNGFIQDETGGSMSIWAKGTCVRDNGSN
jgi:hypothetical protein